MCNFEHFEFCLFVDTLIFYVSIRTVFVYEVYQVGSKAFFQDGSQTLRVFFQYQDVHAEKALETNQEKLN